MGAKILPETTRSSPMKRRSRPEVAASGEFIPLSKKIALLTGAAGVGLAPALLLTGTGC